jgi:hypothetical protein
MKQMTWVSRDRADHPFIYLDACWRGPETVRDARLLWNRGSGGSTRTGLFCPVVAGLMIPPNSSQISA